MEYEPHKVNSECNRRFEYIEKKIDDFSVIKDTLLELKLLFNQMVVDNQARDIRESKRDEQDDKLTEAINGININLTELNRDNHEMKGRMYNIEQNQKKQEEMFTINWASIIRQGLIGFGLLITGAVLYEVLPRVLEKL
jgi:hypothetical protein